MAANDLGALAEVAASAETLEVYERQTVEIVGRRVGFDVAMFKRLGGEGVHRPGIDPEIWRTCADHWAEFGEDFAPVAAAAEKTGGVAVDVEVLGMRGLQRTSTYRLLMGPHRGTATAMIYFVHRGRRIGALALGRTRGSFSGSEQDHLRELAPTLSICEASITAGGLLRLPRRGAPRLSAREAEVLEYVRLGYTNAQIGRALGSAERTVRNQLSNVYEKLGASNRAEAVAIAAELGLARGR